MASLKLTLTDAAGSDLNDQVTIDLFSQHTSKQYQTSRRIQRDIQINGVDVTGGPFYRLMVTPANHRIIQMFVSLSEEKLTECSIAVPMDPQKVVSISGPSFGALNSKAQQMLTESEVPRFNDGAGGFAPKQDFPAANATSIVVGDFNRDGLDDLLVNVGFVSSLPLLMANGSGGFSPRLAPAAGRIATMAEAALRDEERASSLHDRGGIRLRLDGGWRRL